MPWKVPCVVHVGIHSCVSSSLLCCCVIFLSRFSLRFSIGMTLIMLRSHCIHGSYRTLQVYITRSTLPQRLRGYQFCEHKSFQFTIHTCKSCNVKWIVLIQMWSYSQKYQLPPQQWYVLRTFDRSVYPTKRYQNIKVCDFLFLFNIHGFYFSLAG